MCFYNTSVLAWFVNMAAGDLMNSLIALISLFGGYKALYVDIGSL